MQLWLGIDPTITEQTIPASPKGSFLLLLSAAFSTAGLFLWQSPTTTKDKDKDRLFLLLHSFSLFLLLQSRGLAQKSLLAFSHTACFLLDWLA